MDFGQWLENVRQKPHATRTRYMWVSASAIIVVVFSFWVVSVKHELKAVFERGRAENSLTALAGSTIESTTPSLFDALKASVDDFLAIFKGAPATTNTSEPDKPEAASTTGAETEQPEKTQPTGPQFLPGTKTGQ